MRDRCGITRSHCAPSAWVIVLTALELLLPPLMLAWQRQALGVEGDSVP